MLPGVARGIVIELAEELRLDVIEQAPDLRRLPASAEVFCTNAVRGVRPVARLDGRALQVASSASSTMRRMQRALDARMGLLR